MSPIMLASADMEQGSADGYPDAPETTGSLGDAPTAAPEAPAAPAADPVATAAVSGAPQGDGVAGVWNRIVGFTKLDAWGRSGLFGTSDSDDAETPEAASAPAGDRRASATGGLPALSTVNAFAPPLYAADPF